MRRSSLVAALVILCLTGSPAAWAETIAPGVTYTQYTLAGPMKVFVVTIDRTRSEYKFKVGWPQKKRNFTSRAATSTIANLYDAPPNHDVLAATNGSFFGTTPIVLSMTASDGEILQAPDGVRDTFMFGPTRMPFIREDIAPADGVLTFANGATTTLHDYNQDRQADRIVAYTPQWGSTSDTESVGVEIILTNVSYPMRSGKQISGVVSAIKTGSASLNNAIPAGGMIIAARGTTVESVLTANVAVGDRLRMKFSTNTGACINADMAISGSGWLVNNGAANSSNWPQYGSSFANSRHPRTAVGWNNDNLFLVVVDGRSTASVGMSLAELANFMIGTLGCIGAENLDGGGSSTMWVNGSVRNVPSDGSERAVGNAVLLVKQPTATQFPFSDAFGPAGRAAGWDEKFTYNGVIPFSPTSPGGDGYVVEVSDPAGGVETLRRGDWGDTDYAVQADIYCEYRPGVASNGLERYAIFARDDGMGSLGLTSSTVGSGNCYALVYDSDNGRIRGGRYVNGSLTDLIASPLLAPSTAWRRFRIECKGSRIRYLVDGVAVADVTDTTFARGYFGIGYHDLFSNNANIRGTRADNFLVTLPPSAPGKATQPNPAHLTTAVSVTPTLSWTPGSEATAHRVYFGAVSPGAYRGEQAGGSYVPSPLAYASIYYWRIDEVNAYGTTTGDVWQFRTILDPFPPDRDDDGDTDLDDYGSFQLCLAGSDVPPPNAGCLTADLDNDGDVDAADRALFVACLGGTDQLPAPGCTYSPQ